MTDYKELCLELFGTLDENKIREQYAIHYQGKSSGRKPMFDDAKISELHNLVSEGYSINELAKKYNTSRQVISKYLNRESEYQFNLRLTYMYKQFPCTIIDVDYVGRKIKIQNRTDNLVHRAFGSNENPGWKDYEDFLESRCFSKSREDIKDILRELQIDSFDSLQIIEKTQGRCYDDDMWVKIKHFPRIKYQ